jgi:hypothetical protein
MSEESGWNDVVPALSAMRFVNIECGEYEDEEGTITPLGRLDLYYELEDGSQHALRFLLDQKDSEDLNGMLGQMVEVLAVYANNAEEAE